MAGVECHRGRTSGAIARPASSARAGAVVGTSAFVANAARARSAAGLANSGTAVLRIQSTLAEPVFEAAYDDKRETPRRWLPG